MSQRPLIELDITDIQARSLKDLEILNKEVEQNPRVVKHRINRALCLLKLKRWDETLEEFRQALAIEPNSAQTHFFLGFCLAHEHYFDKAIEHLLISLNNAKKNNLGMVQLIDSQLSRVRKDRWKFLEEKCIQKETELHSYLHGLIEQDIKKRCTPKRKSRKNKNGGLTKKQLQIKQECDNHMNELNELFVKINHKRQKREVPDILCCGISLDLVNDPVITPSGITYERSFIESHIKVVGEVDPITGRKLRIDQLIPNRAMKDVAEAFIADNEWALLT